MTPVYAELESGQLFADRYRVEGSLGRGGMGAVYRVRDEQLDEVVALKLIAVPGVKPQDLERFKREVKLARRITHPNVARTYDIGEHQGIPFLTMEFVNGHSLDSLIHGPMDPTQAVGIALAVARGLEAAHAAAVVHRDLKPANVLVEQSGRVVLTDFGVARSVLEQGGAQLSGVIGTPAYMSPEQVLGEAIEHRSDIYSFGLLLYEMLTGKLPFDSDNAMAAALARCRHEPEDPRRHALVPDALAELVLACLSTDVDGRPASARIVAQHLQSWLDSSGAAYSGTVAFTPASAAPLVVAPAPLPTGRTLAVLPFSAVGAHDYLGDSLAQELIDVMARSRGMRVLAFGAVGGYRPPCDPRKVGRELGVDVIVEGTAQTMNDRVRISVRLHEVDSGVQIWSERFDGEFADVFDMQTIMSQRIANALRVELSVVDSRGTVSSDALSFYMQGRRELSSPHYLRGVGAVDLFERCLAISPGFKPALAAHATACMQAWWASIMEPNARDWPTEAEKSVERAMAGAPELAEAHLASAVYGLAVGDVRHTVEQLMAALEIAPGLADAHRYLGELQCEVGRVDEGRARLRLALELDSSRTAAHLALARRAALEGDDEAFERCLAPLESVTGPFALPALIMRMRRAGWREDRDTMRALVARAEKIEGLAMRLFTTGTRFALGEGDDDLVGMIEAWLTPYRNVRMNGFVGQLLVEVLSFRGAHDQAMDWLVRTAEEGLVDLEWLQKCPSLAPLRGQPAFERVAARVQSRAGAIRWVEAPST
jgi:serine/threonine-protein kinase